MNPVINVIASAKNWIEGEAIKQLENCCNLPGMLHCIGLPDLHPGKAYPIGAALISQDYIYPYLVGNDIGCGMGLWTTDLRSSKLKLEKWVKKLKSLDETWNEGREWLKARGLPPTDFDSSLGTIGGGNHFAELQMVHEILAPELFQSLNLEADKLLLLVHSGSRGYGESILRNHVTHFQAKGLQLDTPEAQTYLEAHQQAFQWAVVNRECIAHRFLEAIGAEGQRIIDICHNSVTAIEHESSSTWLHRKGAAPADQGPIVIPGSRGSYSYLVKPTGAHLKSGYSLAHGAGRKWKRSESKDRLKQRYTADKLKRTELGSYVICEDKQLIYEEAPQAYKNIDTVVQDLVDFDLIEIIASLKPLITYKTWG